MWKFIHFKVSLLQKDSYKDKKHFYIAEELL